MYNYFDAMKKDVMGYIEDNIDLSEWKGNRDELEEKLRDDLWTEDSVTGNGSGSYTFNRVKAQLYVLDNIDELVEACNEFCVDDATVGEKFLSEDWEWFDVTLRCYFLSMVVGECLDDLQVDEAI